MFSPAAIAAINDYHEAMEVYNAEDYTFATDGPTGSRAYRLDVMVLGLVVYENDEPINVLHESVLAEAGQHTRLVEDWLLSAGVYDWAAVVAMESPY